MGPYEKDIWGNGTIKPYNMSLGEYKCIRRRVYMWVGKWSYMKG